MISFREAKKEDLSQIVAIFADDILCSGKEKVSDSISDCYTKAFENIQKQNNNTIIVALNNNEVIGYIQLVVIQGIVFCGTKRLQIELVMVRPDYRNQGIGRQLINYAIERAKEEKCGMIQLTTDKIRKDAHRFYENLGFVSSHYGMKFYL